jgi:hypothetical protein
MRQVDGTKVTRITLGDLPPCPWQQVCYRRCEAAGWDGRSQQRP